jgi:uncharacterized protein YqhQ
MAGTVDKDLHIGGQAIFEGVMLKSESNLAAAVRMPNDSFSVLKKRLRKKKSFLRWPFIRGIVNLIDMLMLGIKALVWSSNKVLGEKEKLTKKDIIFMVAISALITIAVFVVAPFYLTKIFVEGGILFNILDGIARIIFFVAYIVIISMFADVKVLFQYHGAEHKVVNCFESGKALVMKNIKKYTTLHKRCGTSFIIVVLLLAIVLFSFITAESTRMKILLRVVLIPVIASLAYEFIKLGARYPKNVLFTIFILPGLWLQKITTREPTEKQIEVAVKAMKTLLGMEGVKGK